MNKPVYWVVDKHVHTIDYILIDNINDNKLIKLFIPSEGYVG